MASRLWSWARLIAIFASTILALVWIGPPAGAAESAPPAGTIGPDGLPIAGSIKQNPQAHIPLDDWLTWTSWNAP